MKKHVIDDLVLGTNKRLQKLTNDLISTGTLAFNNELPKNDIESCYNSLIVDRVISKFEKPSAANLNNLKAECFENWLSYDSAHHSVNFFAEELKVRKWVGNVKSKMSEIFKEFTLHFKEAPLELPKRETLVPMKGKTSYYEKISNKNLWTVTSDCVDLAVLAILQHSGLRSCAKKHLPRLSKENHQRMWSQWGHLTLEMRIRTELLIVVHGSRASSVYKNTKKRRFINIEPMFNVIVQKMIGYALRTCLKKHGCDLDLGQLTHRSMIRSDFISTLDFQNASDSTFQDAVKTVVPKKIVDLIELARSHFTLLPTSEGRIYTWPKKVSSMGNGFTFELLTAMLYASAQTFDPNSSVYGDDVIISKLYADDYIKLVSLFGYKINTKKTFHNHPVRESCGAFFIKGYGYVTSYDIKYCKNINDVINSVNKLGRIVKDSPVNNNIVSLFREAYVDLLRLCPALIRGPSSNCDQLPLWVEDDSNMKRKKDDCQKLYRYVLNSYADILTSWCVDFSKLQVGILWEPIEKVLKKPSFEPDFWEQKYYLYTGMRSKVTLKVQDQQYRAVKCLYIEGTPVALREIRRIQKGLRSSNTN